MIAHACRSHAPSHAIRRNPRCTNFMASSLKTKTCTHSAVLGSRSQIWKAKPALLTRTTRSSSVCNKPRRMARFYSPSFCLTLSTLPTSTKPWHTKPSVCISVQWYHDFKLLRTSWDFSIHCLAASGALQLSRPVTHELSKHLSRSGRRPFLLPSRSSRALCQKPSVAALRASLP